MPAPGSRAVADRGEQAERLAVAEHPGRDAEALGGFGDAHDAILTSSCQISFRRDASAGVRPVPSVWRRETDFVRARWTPDSEERTCPRNTCRSRSPT